MKFTLTEQRERKIIQIATDVENLYALCDDGTLWKQISDGGWRKLPNVTQPSRQEWEKKGEDVK